MRLIGTYSNAGLQATADAALAFYERRSDLHTSGLSFGDDPNNPRKVSTDISLVWVDRSDAEAFGISDLLMRAVSAGLNQYLKERELLSQVTPEGALFVVPLFNLQRYAPGEGFKAWHADWSTADDITQPIRRVWPGSFLNDVDNGGTEFHWQDHHVEARRGTLAIFRPASAMCTADGSAKSRPKPLPQAGSMPAPWRALLSTSSRPSHAVTQHFVTLVNSSVDPCFR